MSSTPKNTTQTTKTEPWAGAQPYLLKTYGIADGLVNEGVPNYYPGKNVIDQSWATKTAQDHMGWMAQNGTGTNEQAGATAKNILSGGAFDQAGQNTNKSLMNGISLGTNPAAGGVANFLSDKTAAPGTKTLQQGMNYTNSALGGATKLANVGPNPTTGAFNAAQRYQNAALGMQGATAAALMGGRNPSTSMLEQTANGSMLNANPFLNEAIANSNRGLIDQFRTEIAPGIDSQFAGAGRMGSGAFAAARNKAEGSLAGAMSNNANNIMMQNYQAERSNQLAAQNQIGDNYNSDVGNAMASQQNLASTSDAQQSQRMNAIQGSSNNWNSDFSNRLNGTQLQANIDQNQQNTRLSAANSANSQFNTQNAQKLQALGLQSDVYNSGISNQLNNAGLQLNAANQFNNTQNAQIGQQLGAISQLPTLNDARYYDVNQLAKVGSAQDTYNDLLLQGDIAKWDQNQNKQWDNVARAAALYTGGGYNSATTTKPVYQDRFGQILGTGAAVAGMLCDQRIKTNVKRIGATDGGVPLYSFEYLHEPGRTHIGPMAQEVLEIQPEAVIHLASGILMVDTEVLH